jgi:hypothetical protein
MANLVVMIVDDNDHTRQLLRSIFKALKISQVREAANGMFALKRQQVCGAGCHHYRHDDGTAEWSRVHPHATRRLVPSRDQGPGRSPDPTGGAVSFP